MSKKRVLLAEDDIDFGSILKQYLEIHNFEVVWAKNGKEALDNFKNNGALENRFDICVFDVMMPKMDGFTLAEEVIAIDPEVCFVFLTAKTLKADRLKGLKLGADDYIVKPFEADILVLRLQNILKRTSKSVTKIPQNTSSYSIGLYHFDPANHQLNIDGKIQNITDKEMKLIQHFYAKKNELIKRDDLLQAVWGNDDFFSGRSMDVFISRLRKYFSEDKNISIESTRGVGLTFKLNE